MKNSKCKIEIQSSKLYSPRISHYSPLILILIECFLFTTLRTDLAWGLENSSLSLVGRKNSAKAPGQTLLRPRAGVERARDRGLREELVEAKDGAARKDPFTEVLETTGIFGPEWDSSFEGVLEGIVTPPGVFPFARGNFAQGYREKPFFYRKYSGGKSPEQTNELFKRQLEQVQDLSVAYDLLAQTGRDSDDPLAANEVGLAGVSIQGLWDYRNLWKGIDLGEVTTSHTINQTAPLMFLMYLLVAEEQGVDPKKLRATFQNDVLKEYLSRNTYRLPLDPTLRLWVEMQEYIVKNQLRGIRGTSISSYHIREAGATAAQEIAFMFANDFQYQSAAIARGLSVNDVALPTTYFVNLKQDLLEEVAKMRVFRIVRAKLIQELQRQQRIEEKRAQFFPVMAYTGGSDAELEQPQLNIVRVALKALAGPLGMTQAINDISYDEPHTINTEHPEQIAFDTMHMLRWEKGLTQIVDLFGGSYALEARTRELEEEVWKELAKIATFPTYQEALTYMSRQIEKSSAEELGRIATGEKKRIGKNVATEGSQFFPPPLEPSLDIRKVVAVQKRRLHEAKRKRNERDVTRALQELERAAPDPDAKLFPPLKKALKAHASVGEVMDVLVKVFEESNRAAPWEPSKPVETFTPAIRSFLKRQAETFRADIRREEAEKRGYWLASDIYRTGVASEERLERPGKYPFTRGIDERLPLYAETDPEETRYDLLTLALLYPGRDPLERIQTLGLNLFKTHMYVAPDRELVVGNGYAMREGGISAVQEVAFTLWVLKQYFRIAQSAGFKKEKASRHLAAFLSSHDNFGEEIAKFRAARRLWAKYLKEKEGIQEEEEALKLRIHAKTSESTYTAKKFLNNSPRGTWQALQAYLGQVQTIQITPLDAPFGQPSAASAFAREMAAKTFQIIQDESGLGKVLDPLGGAFPIEAMTRHIEEEASRELENLEAMGPDQAFTYIQEALAQAKREHNAAVREGKIVRIGVNKFQEGPDPSPEAFMAPLSQKAPRPTLEGLMSQDPTQRMAAAMAWYVEGAPLANEARWILGLTDQYNEGARRLPYTVGLAVTPEHFDSVRKAWGNPPLSWVPEDVGVEEFEISADGIHLDILRQKAGHQDRTIEEHLRKRGEGIQQIEFPTKNVKRDLDNIRKRSLGRDKEKLKVVLASPGLDGHDRGLKYVAQILQNAGMEVVYLGLFRTSEDIVRSAIEEDADVIGINILSGAHMAYFSEMAEFLHRQRIDNVLVTGGGIIPHVDRETLRREFGIGPLYGRETAPREMIRDIQNWGSWLKLPSRSEDPREPAKIKILRPGEGPREGANHTRVKFFLVRLPDGRTVLTELVEEPKEKPKTHVASDGGVKSGDFLLYGRAAVPGDVIQYPEQLLENPELDPTQMSRIFEEFVRNEVMPYSEKLDRGEIKVEDSIMGKAAELGFLGMTVPEEYDGLNVPKITKIIADFWAWYADASFASLIRVHGGVGTMPIVMFGTDGQKSKYLPKLASGEFIGAYLLTDEAHGSDSLSKGTMLQTRAILKKDPDTGEEYWELTGNKRFVTNARFSTLFTVFAMTQDESGKWVNSAFIVERDTPGVIVESDYHKMGLRGASTADVKFDNVRVPKENLLGEIGQGRKIGMSILNHGRTAVGSGSLGGSLRLFEETLKFVTERPQFGKHLSDFGAVKEALADMVVSLYAQESVLFAVGGLFDGGEPNPGIEAAITKVFGSEALNRIAYQATQKHGGNGIMEEYAATRFYRDARVMTIFEGANEILLSQVIADQTLKRLNQDIWPQEKTILSEWKTPKESPIASEIEMVRGVASLVDQTAKYLEKKFETPEAKKDPENQSYFMAFGQMVMELFAMTQTVSRTLQRLEKGYESEQEIKMTKAFVTEAAERLQKKASRILPPGSFEKATLPTDTLLALKHEIARKVIELGKYEVGIKPTPSVQDAGSKNTAELYAGVVAAFGDDTVQADEDIAERLAAMQKVNPQATREEAIARLAWEYQPRPREHVFPGDNFSFMYRAAQSGAEILLLDLEDAVATPRKVLARDIIMLLIRAFRGEILPSEDIKFIWDHAIINPKDKEPGVERYFDSFDGREFQLKKEYWFPEDQMILVRPNNLRTKWSAGDYSIVIRGIGHLIDGIYMPKVEGPDDVREVVRIMRGIQREKGWVEGRHKIFVLTELPGAVLTAHEILAIAPEVEEVQLGVVDYTAATGGKNAVQLDHFTYMRWPMLHLVAAAREMGKVAGTGITVRLTVEDTSEDTKKVIKLGIPRKWSVNPKHLEGMAPYLGQFPPILRKRISYPEIKAYGAEELEKLDRFAEVAKPIFPPKVFVPRETELVRSIVRARGWGGRIWTALASDADMVVIDVKHLIRKNVSKLTELFRGKQPQKLIALQANLKEPQILKKLEALIGSLHPIVKTVFIKGVKTAKEIREVDGFLTQVERENGLEIGTIKLGASIESPETVEKEAYPIASASRRLQWLILDIPALPQEAPDDPTMRGYNYYRSAFIAATALADVDAIDGISFSDHLESETLLAANWGFHGKLGIPFQVAKINEMMNPQRAGTPPAKPGKDAGEEEKRAWAAFVERWKNSVERDLDILDEYAKADQDRQLGAVGFTDPYTGLPEIIDAASARIPYRQMERALKAEILTGDEKDRYFKARARLLLALRPGGTEGGTKILPGQRILGNAVTMRPWMVQGFAKTSKDRNRYHLDKEYAETSRFKGFVAHGLLTLSTVLTSFEQILSDYRLESIREFKFSAPVRFDDTIVPIIEGKEAEGEKTIIRLSAVNQEGRTVFEMFASIRPRAPNELYQPIAATPQDLQWLTQWVQDVTPSFPKQIDDFTDPESPREQTVQKEIEGDLFRATQVLFGKVSPELLSQLLAIGSMAMSSAESVPGHLLLGGKGLEFGVPIQNGDQLTATATVPPHDQIKRTTPKDPTKTGDPIVSVTIVVTNQRGETVFKGQVTKLMEPIAAKDGSDRFAPAQPERIPQTLPEFLNFVLLKHPDQTVTFSKKKITYHQLDEQSNRFANALLNLGLQKGDRVTVMLPNSDAYLTAIFGTWKAGAILTTLKTQYKSEEIKRELNETEAKVLVILEDYLPYIESIRTELSHLAHVIVVTRQDLGGMSKESPKTTFTTERMYDLLPLYSPHQPFVKILPEEDAAVAYTTGSTGKPKGVVLSHHAILAATDQAATWLREAGEGPVASLVPITPTYGGNVILAALKEGRPFVTFPRIEGDPHFYQDVVATLEREKVAILFGVPTSFYQLAETLQQEKRTLPHLRIALSRGSKLTMEVQSALERAHPGINVVEGGGLTETSTYVTNPVDRKKVGTVGIANPGVVIKIVDPETLRELPIGQTGEILILAPQRMSRYWKDLEETKHSLLPDGWVRSGDLGVLDEEGFLTYQGRLKELIITGGFNVSPIEIEGVLQGHPKIRGAAVAGISDPEWFATTDVEGRELVRRFGEVVVAFVVLKGEKFITAQEIVNWVKRRIADYEVPKRIVFVDAIPRIGAYDKPDRRALIEAYAAKDGGTRHGVIARKDPRGFSVITINRPGAFPTNALSPETFAALDEALEEANRDESVKSIILTGGGGHFIGGGDIQYVLEHVDSEEALRNYFQLAKRVSLKIAKGKPVIAAIPGEAVGGGVQLAFAARLRIGQRGGYLRMPEVRRLNIIPGFGGTQLIPRVLGIRKGLALMLKGEKITEGVFDEVVEDPLKRAEEIAADFAQGNRLESNIRDKLVTPIFDRASEGQRNEWTAVFKKDGTLRQAEDNRTLLEILDRHRREGREKAATAVIQAVKQGFIKSLEEGFEIETALTLIQTQTEEARSSLAKRLEEAERSPWLDFYPVEIPGGIAEPRIPIHEFIENALHRYPDQPIHLLSGRQGDPGGRTIRYRDLKEPADQFARALYARGVRQGDRIAVMVPDSLQYIVALLAASKIGAILVGMDIFSAPQELRDQLTLTKPKAFVVLDEYYSRFTEIRLATPRIENVIVTKRNDFITPSEEALEDADDFQYFTNLLKEPSPEVPQVEVDPEETAVLAFTGGLTGTPKAAELTHRNLISAALQRSFWIFQGVDLSGEVVMADLPYYHSYGLTAGLLMGLSQGAEMVILPHYSKEHVDALVEALSYHKVTYLIGLPTTFDRVVGHLGQDSDLPIDLKGGISGGAPLEEETREAFEMLTGAWLRQGFGLTEASLVSHEPIGKLPLEGSIGMALPDVEAMVVDPRIKDRLVPVHENEPGELVVRGPQVFNGYWKNPKETEAVKTKEGWLRTGDLVRIDREKRIFLLGREKNMVKVRGNQVFPSEVEKVLARHPKIVEVAVFGIPDEVEGEKVVAYVLPKEEPEKEGSSLTADEIRDFITPKLARFKIPTIIRMAGGPLPRHKDTKQIDYQELKWRAFRRHLVDSVAEGKWAWAFRQLEQIPLPREEVRKICVFCVEELKKAYDAYGAEIGKETLEGKRLPVRLFFWSLVQHPDLIEPELKEEMTRQLAFWKFRDHQNAFLREPVPDLAESLRALQKGKQGGELFESAWQAIRHRYANLTPPDIFRVSRELTRPKAVDVAKSFLFRDFIELNDPDNPFDITKNQKYIPTLEEIQQTVYEWGFSVEEAVEYLRARHDSHYDDKSVLAGIATFVDPYHPEKQVPVMIVGLQKGSTTKENLQRNQGFTMPWGYWKYIRAIRLAEKLRLPVISLVDVTGAWNGLSGAVEDVSGAVSYAIQVGAQKTVPGTVIVTGEGGSAGGLAATMDKTYMLSNSTRFVATPDGQFAILRLNRRLVSLVIAEVKSELGKLFSLDENGEGTLILKTQERMERANRNQPWAVNDEFLINTLFETVPELGGTITQDQALIEPFKKRVRDTWQNYRDQFINRIIVATQADPRGGLRLGAIGGIIDEPTGGAHRFPEGAYLAMGREISAFLDHVEGLSTEEVIRERYEHFRQMGNVEGRDYVVKSHALRRRKAVGEDLKRGRLGIQDWLMRLVDRGKGGGPLIHEIDPNMADLDEGPIKFYENFDLPKIFPFNTYRRNLVIARRATGSWSGVFTGYVKIGGEEAMLIIKDPRFAGASDKSGVVGEKITRAIEDVIRQHDTEGIRIPIVFINTASGARQQDGPRSIDPLNKNNAALSKAKDRQIPFINVDTVYIYGGDTASTSSYQDATMLLATKWKKPQGEEGEFEETRKGFTGPPATASVERRNLPELYFSADFLVKRGFLDGVVEMDQLKDLLILYLNPETENRRTQEMKPVLQEIQRRREERVKKVRERERRTFYALSQHSTWVRVRLDDYLRRLSEQYANSSRKPWMAEYVDTSYRPLVPGPKGRYVPGRPTFPKHHHVNSPEFLADARAVLEKLKPEEPSSARDGAAREWHPEIADRFATRWKMGETLAEPSPLLVPIVKKGGKRAALEAEQEVAWALVEIFRQNPGAALLTIGSQISIEELARNETILVLDGALLESEITRKEFEIILYLLKKARRTAPIWLVDTAPEQRNHTHRELLRSLADLYDEFVQFKEYSDFRAKFVKYPYGKTPFFRIAQVGNEEKMELPHITVPRPKEGESVSAFTFMSFALGKLQILEWNRRVGQQFPIGRDFAAAEAAMLEALMGHVHEFKKSLLITPNVEYFRSIETVYRQL